MLELSKLRANKLILPSEPFEVPEICRECAALVKHLLVGSPVELHVEADPELPKLCGSPFHLKQILLNLLTNACKYTDKGTIVLRVDRLRAMATNRLTLAR